MSSCVPHHAPRTRFTPQTPQAPSCLRVSNWLFLLLGSPSPKHLHSSLPHHLRSLTDVNLLSETYPGHPLKCDQQEHLSGSVG